MSECNHPECNLPVYSANSDGKCVLHCEKEEWVGTSLELSKITVDFYNALKAYIVEHSYNDFVSKKGDIESIIQIQGIVEGFGPRSLQGFESILEEKVFESRGTIRQVLFTSIFFPKEDKQSKSHDYLTLFRKCNVVEFDSCHFQTSQFNPNMHAEFRDCEFYNEIVLDRFNTSNLKLPTFSNCIFNKKVKNASSMGLIQHVYFDEYCSFRDGVNLEGLVFDSNIFITVNQIDEIESKPERDFKGTFRFFECTFKVDQEIFLDDASEADFEFNNCDIKRKLKVRGREYREGYEYEQNNKSPLKSLKINSCKIANDENSYLRIGFLKDCKFELKNLKNQASSELNIGDCHFKYFQLTNFRNLGKFKLFKINVLDKEFDPKVAINDRFSIDNTSIGKADFQSINLKSFKEVFFFDNILSEIDYTNVQWESDIQVDQYNSDINRKLAKKRDTYRTLKNVAIRNRDQPQALIFYAKEMENHYSVTKWSKEPFNKLTLAFNNYTNLFGMSWWRPAWLLLSIAMIFYLELLKSTGGICIYDDFMANYWVFLNPTHKTEFVAKGCWTGWTYFVDLSFRILEALLIYQIIQGFRKFTRKL